MNLSNEAGSIQSVRHCSPEDNVENVGNSVSNRYEVGARLASCNQLGTLFLEQSVPQRSKVIGDVNCWSVCSGQPERDVKLKHELLEPHLVRPRSNGHQMVVDWGRWRFAPMDGRHDERAGHVEHSGDRTDERVGCSCEVFDSTRLGLRKCAAMRCCMMSVTPSSTVSSTIASSAAAPLPVLVPWIGSDGAKRRCSSWLRLVQGRTAVDRAKRYPRKVGLEQRRRVEREYEVGAAAACVCVKKSLDSLGRQPEKDTPVEISIPIGWCHAVLETLLQRRSCHRLVVPNCHNTVSRVAELNSFRSTIGFDRAAPRSLDLKEIEQRRCGQQAVCP